MTLRDSRAAALKNIEELKETNHQLQSDLNLATQRLKVSKHSIQVDLLYLTISCILYSVKLTLEYDTDYCYVPNVLKTEDCCLNSNTKVPP